MRAAAGVEPAAEPADHDPAVAAQVGRASVVIPVLAAYLLLDYENIVRTIIGLFPVEHRAKAKAVLFDLDLVLGGFIRGQLLDAVNFGARASQPSGQQGSSQAILEKLVLRARVDFRVHDGLFNLIQFMLSLTVGRANSPRGQYVEGVDVQRFDS